MTSLRSVNHMAAIRAMFGDAWISSPEDYPKIPGLVLHPYRVNRDPRGTLTELLRTDWDDVYAEDQPFAQAYVSYTHPGVARDEEQWHVHHRQTDRFVCLAGRFIVAAVDWRETSPVRGTLALIDMTSGADEPAPWMVTIPPGVLHTVLAAGDSQSLLMNLPTRLYDASDEARVSFRDAAVTLKSGKPFTWNLVRQALGMDSVSGA